MVADALYGPAGPQPALRVSVRLSMAIIAAALLAFILIRRCSLRRSNSCERTINGVEEEVWGGGGGEGYHQGVGIEDRENRGDESTIIPSHHGRGGGRYGSSTNIIIKADDDGNDNGIGCILLDLAMSGYHQQLQRQPRRQWLSWWSASSAAEVSCCDTEATPRISNCTAAHNTDLPCKRCSNINAFLPGIWQGGQFTSAKLMMSR